ncbi:hypothetical protein CTEN210_17592 [Chaetoceros tenuissimus]|uniref:PI31 proteasome regulator N-terminal domain-containing protein n=1 Tax=Chaetoceros tenuissimus TaxID=426638 RepID=A0AAD3DD56_9STRA|nr:hypothetical protein CTEN210_17592 [Chaetoceros tenuissimus]
MSERDEIQKVKDYLLKCKTVPTTSNAIRIAVASLDLELKKLDRDEKLREMFIQSNGSDIKEKEAGTQSALSDDSMGVRVELDESGNEQDIMRTVNNNDTSNEDWQEVEVDAAMEIADSFLGGIDAGNILLQQTLTGMSEANTRVKTPLAAIALALHSALLSQSLGFKCTGIPDDECCFNNDDKEKSAKKRGFAAPIRELPRGVFVPRNWDASAQKVTMRYSKTGMPATILRVQSIHANKDVKVNFGPLGGEPSELIFPLDQHFNLSGFNLVVAREPNGVKPALYYVGLSRLLSEFCNKNDLGIVVDDTETTTFIVEGDVQNSIPKKEEYVGPPVQPPPVKKLDLKIEKVKPPNTDLLLRFEQQLRHGQRLVQGDFSNDLLPSGIPDAGFADPLRQGNNPVPSGNLMGPNHPAFHRQFYSEDNNDGSPDFMTPGGVGMQPRFDPYYPPGVGGRGLQPGRGRGRGRGGPGRFNGGGDPNPDHLRPPNNFGGGDMFM